MSLLNHLTFSDHSGINAETDAFSIKIAVHHANRVYQPDWSKVTIDGEFDKGSSLRIVLRNSDGTVCDDVVVENCCVTGEFLVTARPGSNMRDCIKRDPGTQLASFVRHMEGLDRDHPMDVSIVLGEFGRMTVSAMPCL